MCHNVADDDISAQGQASWELRPAGTFYESETGNDALDIPGFDLEGVEEADVAAGTVLIKGLRL